MKKFTVLKGVVVPFDRANVDTDAIIPKQFLKSLKRSGFGPNLFDEWRYLDHGEPGMDNGKRPVNEKFILNWPCYKNPSILLTRKNFGCGSSREHAPWALLDYGFRSILAPSFADIFYNNCFKNGILPIVLAEETIDELFASAVGQPGYQLSVDLEKQIVGLDDDTEIHFEVDAFRKHALLNGLDEIAMTLAKKQLIEQYESQRSKQVPWLFT